MRNPEEQATATRFVLSAHTVGEGKQMMPGTIQLDAKRAVRVIAAGLRADRAATLAAVRRADDQVGDGPGHEQLERRLDHAAATAEFPWQFCFILGGGWRRANALASSARAADTNLVLPAAAIRQLATRDARCSAEQLAELISDTRSSDQVDQATVWLIQQRLLIAATDLRCPHQRLASVLLVRIIEGQSTEVDTPSRRCCNDCWLIPKSLLAALRYFCANWEMPASGNGNT